MKSPQASYAQTFIIRDNYIRIITSSTITLQTIAPDQTSSKEVASEPPDNYPPLDNYPKTTGPLWMSPLDYCWEMFRVESELHLSEASIATGDPSRRGIVNPLLELWSFSFFSLVLCYWVTKLKRTFSHPPLELISSSTSSRLPSQVF